MCLSRFEIVLYERKLDKIASFILVFDYFAFIVRDFIRVSDYVRWKYHELPDYVTKSGAKQRIYTREKEKGRD